MPNNFKITIPNSIYVSKAGNDSNSGFSPDSPKLTINGALSAINATYQRIVIGSGYYSENVSYGSGNLLAIIGDGTVIIDQKKLYSFALPYTVVIQNIYFKNYTFQLNGIISGDFFYLGSIITSTFGPFGGIATRLKNSVFVNSKIFSSGVYLNYEMDGCIFINSSFYLGQDLYGNGGYTGFKNSYVNSNSNIAFVNGYPGVTVFNNNIQGTVTVFSNGAVSGVNSNGVALSFAQHIIDYPTYNVRSFSSDPKFNNPRLLDFTLQSGSPHISASSDYISNIGNTQYAVPFTASSAAFTTNATSQSLDYRQLYYAISGSEVSGSITSGPMFLQWPRTKPLTAVNWIGALEFNKNISASLSGNNNVPAYTTFTSASLQAGANPDRLKIQMRFSTQQTQPSTDGEWDNNGYWTAGTYQLFEINTKPKIDSRGVGNGDPSYVETSAIGDLVPSWIQTRIILRNDYNL